MKYSSLSELRPLRLDTLAAIGGLLIALVLLPLRMFASQIYLNTVPIILGTACTLYLLSLYQQNEEGTYLTFPSTVTMALPSIVFVGLAGLVTLSVVQGERTLLFFVGSGIVGTLVVAQIVFASDQDLNPGLLLLQIVLFAAVFRFTALYVTQGYIGIDIWTHTRLIQSLVSEGSLNAISENKHYASPFYHLMVATSSILYDVPIRSALYLSLGIVLTVSVLLVYATTNLLVSTRWAILATALYAMGSHVARWGMHIIPTSLGLVFFLAVLYALIRVMRIEYTTRDFSFLVLLSVAVIFTHQVSTFIMLVLLLAAFLAQLVFAIGPLGLARLDTSVFRTKKPVNLIGLVVFDAGLTIFVWSVTPYGDKDSFLKTVLSYFEQTVKDSAGFLAIESPGSSGSAEAGAETASTLLDQVVPYVDNLGFLLLLGITFVGCLYVLHRRRAEQSVFTLLLAAAFMLVFVLALPMFGIDNFIPTRWFAFLFAPMAILGAVGLRTLRRNLSPRVVVAVLLVVVLIYPGAMAFSAESNVDNPVFPHHHERLAYEESELAAVDSIGELTGRPKASELDPSQELYTDHPYQTLIGRTGAYDRYETKPATLPAEGTHEYKFTVYRSRQSNPGTYFNATDGVPEITQISRSEICRPDQATVYTNGDVTLCTPSPATR
ncbi:hypothetical protein [Natrinema halophilum]|uniref:Glycosyltransferase RgtA/B/C/D-like domain-containing protein n=1 Tax=Natrinema halophilum TaxID=1699371 RepID=A0A7D5KFC4_9EURY|nr:hypothetical protein [Natrinema halophilum]QLG50761.1 hypothetical protein HYG82_18920 [Natrinema halophilum]